MNKKSNFSLIKMLLIFISLSLYHSAISKFFLNEKSSKLMILNKVKDINGVTYCLKNKICVFIFIDRECPISQFYTKILQNIYLKHAKREIIFLAVFPTKYTPVEDIKLFNKKYQLDIPSVLDDSQNITQKLNATTTPQVFVLNKKQEIYYYGCIDDSYFALGKRNLNPTKFYLEDALTSIIKDKKPIISHSKAVGCEIQRLP